MADSERPTDTELIDALEELIRDRDYVLIHNTNGSDDPRWPKGYTGGGIGLLPWHNGSLREALGRISRHAKGKSDAR